MLFRRRDGRGQSLVEFALILPILITFALAVLDFGRLFYYDVEFENALREGVRYAAQNDNGALKPNPYATLTANTKTIVQHETSITVVSAIPTQVPGTATTSQQPMETVTGTYNFNFISPWFQSPPFGLTNPLVIRTKVAAEIGTGY